MKISIKTILTASLLALLSSVQTGCDQESGLNLTRALSTDEMKGRVFGSAENIKARELIAKTLKRLNVKPAGDDNTYFQNFTNGDTMGANVVGILYPPGQTTGAPQLLISAHYDGVKESIEECHVLELQNESEVCNAAADNAAGVGAIVETLTTVARKMKAPLAVVFFDGEESANTTSELSLPGRLGSSHFALNPTFPINKLKLHINMESIGYNAFTGMENHIFVIGAHSGGEALQNLVDSKAQGSKLDIQRTHYAFGQTRTDIDSFLLAQWTVPFLIFTNGPVSTYHTNADSFKNLNKKKLNAISNITSRLTLSTLKKEAFNYSPLRIEILDQVGGPFVVPNFAAVTVINGLAQRILDIAKLNPITEEQIAFLHYVIGWSNLQLAAGEAVWNNNPQAWLTSLTLLFRTLDISASMVRNHQYIP